MYNFSFENQGTNTYLVYSVNSADILDSMSLGMLTNNSIKGLAPAIFTQMDMNKYIKYNVSAHISVKQFFMGPVNKKRLIGVFNGIVDAMLSAEDYMIDVNSILLDLEYIFADVSTCETILICLPIISDSFQKVDLSSFFKSIMFSTQFDQTENCDHVAKIINYLNGTPVFSLSDFKKILDSLAVMPSAVPQQPDVQRVIKSVVQRPVTAPPNTSNQQATAVVPNREQSPVQTPVQSTPVPQSQKIQQPEQQHQVKASGGTEKKISMFGLMMHYSKENAALYKAQKEAKKKGQVPVATPVPQQPKKQPSMANKGFAIPGQETPAVQQASVLTSTQNIQKPIQQPVQQKNLQSKPTYIPTQMPQGQSMSFGETTVLGGGGMGETTVLGANTSTQVKPHLLRIKNNEVINLDKPVFRIGKEKSYVDYFIGDNSAISRSHANIICRENEYFVVDTNSTNHTYVNGAIIQSNVETKVTHGTKIRFANEEFEFKLY